MFTRKRLCMQTTIPRNMSTNKQLHAQTIVQALIAHTDNYASNQWFEHPLVRTNVCTRQRVYKQQIAQRINSQQTNPTVTTVLNNILYESITAAKKRNIIRYSSNVPMKESGMGSGGSWWIWERFWEEFLEKEELWF